MQRDYVRAAEQLRQVDVRHTCFESRLFIRIWVVGEDLAPKAVREYPARDHADLARANDPDRLPLQVEANES